MKTNVDQRLIENTAASFVTTDKTPKQKEIKEALHTLGNLSSTRSSKKKRLSSVHNDIQAPSQPSSSVGSSSANPSTSGGLFGGARQHWEADPLTLFMFENAPIIIELCMRSQEAMTQAQVTQTKLQSQAALQNAKDTAAKGLDTAEQYRMKAAGEFAQAGIAALQGGLMLKDVNVEDETFSKDLESHENVVSALNKGTPSNTTSGGGSIETEASSEEVAEAEAAGQPSETGSDSLTAKEREAIKERASEFKRVRQEKYNAAIEKMQESNHDWYKTSRLGLSRSESWVNGERELLATRQSTREAYDEVLAKPVDDLKTAEGNSLLDGNTPRAKEARQLLARELFNEEPVDAQGTLEKPPLSASQRMDLIGDWGNGSRLQQKMLEDYGCTKEGAAMKADFEGPNGALRMASEKANIEASKNKRIQDTRQLVLQNLMGQSFNAIFDWAQKQYIIAASQAESSASIEGSLSQLYGQAKSAEESYVQNSIKDMTGIFEWFQSMHGQLLSAQTAAASA